jgi:hypothetical protein
MTEAEFRSSILTNGHNVELLRRLPALGLPDCHLTAGCLYQTLWNGLSGNAPEWGIKDYDVFYFDDRDLSWAAEDRVIRRVAEATADLPIAVEVRNQARVHLWYPERFGSPYPQLTSARGGIDLYLVSCTCVGMDAVTGELYLPDGLDDLVAGTLRMNPLNAKPDHYREKAESYRQRWPWLSIVD